MGCTEGFKSSPLNPYLPLQVCTRYLFTRIMKLKICSFCQKETVLWKANPKACKTCWAQFKASQANDSSKQANTLEKAKSPSYRIKSVSDKKLAELKEYRVVRDRYLKNNPVCEYPNCTSREVELHHRAGRSGNLLCDGTYFCSLCRTHHRLIEEQHTHAKELGLSVSRLDK